jgi:RNA polymerase sigma-70 factor (ECF subfamily)
LPPIFKDDFMERETRAAGDTGRSSESIAALLKQIGEGNRSALLGLYDRTSPLLFGIALGILEEKAAAEESLLDVYTQVWSRARSYNPELFTPLEWLVTVARSRAIARLHQNKGDKKKQKVPADVADSPMTVAPEQQKAVRSSIASLVPAQQEILVWAFYSGLSASEIAARIGKPIGAVRTHARLALSKLENLPRLFPKQEEKPEPGEP